MCITNFRKLDKQVLNAIVFAIGKPYKFNCFDLSGFDCYTLIYYLYSKAGLKLPKENIGSYSLKVHSKIIQETALNFDVVSFLNRQELDILLFESSSSVDAHLGMVLDYYNFIHVDKTHTVRIEPFARNIMLGKLRKVYRWKS